MEYFDTFDENGVFVSSEDEQDVHYKGLWHKIIRIWIYDNEGNIWLKRSKQTGKLDTINEVHLRSSESVVNCFDRAMFESLGIHLPATSKVTFVGMKKMSINKKFSDNSEFKGNYFLCDYLADFNDVVRFFIFDNDTEAVVKCNALGVINLITSKANQIVGYECLADSINSQNKIILSIGDLNRSKDEDMLQKYNSVLNIVDLNIKKLSKMQKEEEMLRKYANVDQEETHADDNEGAEVY